MALILKALTLQGTQLQVVSSIEASKHLGIVASWFLWSSFYTIGRSDKSFALRLESYTLCMHLSGAHHGFFKMDPCKILGPSDQLF
jgi:hypothetical protein